MGFIQEILPSTVVGSVGATGQLFAGRNYTITELTTKFDPLATGNVIDAYYTFPATDLLNDQSANAYNLTGTNVTDADNTTGIMNTNYAVDLNGTDEYMKHATLWDTMPTAMCISAWIKMTDGQPTGTNSLFYKQGSAANHVFCFYIATTGVITFYSQNGGALNGLSASTVLPNGATGWYHLVCNQDATNGMRLWVNGKLENQNPTLTTLPTGGATTDMFIGSTGAPGSYFGGKIANLLFMDYVMTQADVDWLYGTALSLPSALQGKNFTAEAFMKESATGSTRQVWCDEVVRETDRVIVSGGTRRSTDYYQINGRF